jgi:signal peptide peptidase SppA
MFDINDSLLLASPWAISEPMFSALGSVAFDSPARRTQKPQVTQRNQTAIIPIYGMISQRGSYLASLLGLPDTSCQQVSRDFKRALDDPAISRIVFDVDSPGGSVFGVGELASQIVQARGQKPVVAVCNSTAASAAYWIASACDRVFITPGGQAGSIGVFVRHEDISEKLRMAGLNVSLIVAGQFKVEDHPFGPLTKEAKAATQRQVNAYYEMFTASVARGRHTSPGAVRDGFGKGRALMDSEAVRAGLCDKVATLDEVLRMQAPSKQSTAQIAAHRRRLEINRAMLH